MYITLQNISYNYIKSHMEKKNSLSYLSTISLTFMYYVYDRII